MSLLDEQGQPIKNFNTDAIMDRHIDELIGFCRGVSADGAVNQAEAEYLARWIEEHRPYADQYPINVLYKRLSEMLSDGVLDAEESAELLDVIRSLTGEAKRDETPAPNTSTALPLDNPAPEITIPGRNFVFTGVFTVGTRKQCEEIIVERGGKMQKNITTSTDYLVIGDIGSEQWIYSSHGRKIEKAVNYRETGVPIAIISEHYWIKFI